MKITLTALLAICVCWVVGCGKAEPTADPNANAGGDQGVTNEPANKPLPEDFDSLKALDANAGGDQGATNEPANKPLLEDFDSLKALAEKGDARAQSSLGAKYFKGEGVKRDFKKALKLFRKAAEKGDAKGQNGLGLMYYIGEGVPKDSKEAVKWYRKAVEQGYAKAQFNLGNMYAKGEGVPKDDKEAVKWYRKAAEQGDVDSQFNLGNRYYYGNGVPKDLKESVEWYHKAAEQGDVDSQLNLGLMYDRGEGVLEDDKESVEWYRKAAEQGHVDAQFNIGLMYANGSGVPKDDATAYAWWNIATSAAAKKNKGIIAKRMTAGDISKAQALSKEMLKENPNLLSKGGSETSPSMPIIKGFQLGMTSDEAKNNLDKRLDKNLQNAVGLEFTDDKLVSISFEMKSEASAKLFNDGSVSIKRFAEEFGKAYNLPITFRFGKRSTVGYFGFEATTPPYFELTSYSYENTELGYSIRYQTKDLVNKNRSRVPGVETLLMYSKIKASSELNLGD